MALRKYKNLFNNDQLSNQSKKKPKPHINDADNAITKQEIEQLKLIISNKLKGPDMAKKAAEILKQWGLRD